MKKIFIIFVLYLLLPVCFQTVHAFYDPQQGRWLSRDPFEEQGGVNLYRFTVSFRQACMTRSEKGAKSAESQ